MRHSKTAAYWLALAMIWAAAGPLGGQAMYYRTLFFKPGMIRQVVVYAMEFQGNNQFGETAFILNIFTNPPIEGEGILTFATPVMGDAEKANSYFYLTQIAEKIKSGVITGVIYSPENWLGEVNGMYFNDAGNYKAYRIRGFYFLPGQASAAMQTNPVMIQAAPIAVTATASPALMPSLAGSWRSNVGVVYIIEQTGAVFSWTVAFPQQTANGTINGKKVQASWWEGQQQKSAEGQITETNAQNQATVIVWNNGVTFVRQ